MMKRLDLLVSLVNEGKIVADIGTDHGITAIEIYEKKKPKKVIATDISENSLQKLRDKIKINKYDIETIVTDGIYSLTEFNVEEIIISGMGGYLISEIIDRGMEVAKNAEKLILQANNSLDWLRRYLHNNGFEIEDEKMCFDEGIYYFVIITKYTGKTYLYEKDVYYEYGYNNVKMKNDIFINFLNSKIDEFKGILINLEGLSTKSAMERKDELKKEINKIEEIKCL